MSNIIIPESVTSIGESAFSGCTSLNNLVIPKKITSIGNKAFENCTSLEKLEIPIKISNIREIGLNSCSNLKKLYIQYTRDELAKLMIIEVPGVGNVFIGKFFPDKCEVYCLENEEYIRIY